MEECAAGFFYKKNPPSRPKEKTKINKQKKKNNLFPKVGWIEIVAMDSEQTGEDRKKGRDDDDDVSSATVTSRSKLRCAYRYG